MASGVYRNGSIFSYGLRRPHSQKSFFVCGVGLPRGIIVLSGPTPWVQEDDIQFELYCGCFVVMMFFTLTSFFLAIVVSSYTEVFASSANHQCQQPVPTASANSQCVLLMPTARAGSQGLWSVPTASANSQYQQPVPVPTVSQCLQPVPTACANGQCLRSVPTASGQHSVYQLVNLNAGHHSSCFRAGELVHPTCTHLSCQWLWVGTGGWH